MTRLMGIKIIAAFIMIFVSTSIIFIMTETGKNISDIEPSPSYRQEGNPKAKIIIIEYSDFACPACANAYIYLKNLIKYFGNDFVVNFKHFPLMTIHPYSFQAAVWAECAGKEYGKFWEFSDVLIKNRMEWSNNRDFSALFSKYAKEIGINPDLMKKCVSESNAIEIVKKDIEKADKLKLDSTPTFFVNGKIAVGLMELIELIKKEKNEF
ncbi:MAG: DsbA family protein [Elusimicrobiota bacterium]